MGKLGARRGGRAAAAARLAAASALSEPDGHALAGLLDAEGSFSIRRNNQGRNWLCSVRLALRRDDLPILLRFRGLTGVLLFFGQSETVYGRQVISEFLRIGGRVINGCGSRPCYIDGYNGP